MDGSNGKVPVFLYLQSNDGTICPIEIKYIKKSKTLMQMLNDLQIDVENVKQESLAEPIKIPSCSVVLKRLIKWCELYHDKKVPIPNEKPHFPMYILSKEEVEMCQFEGDDGKLLMEFVNLADFLDIPELLETVTMYVAIMMQGRTVAEIRKHFVLENDFTQDEQEELMAKYEWFQGENFDKPEPLPVPKRGPVESKEKAKSIAKGK